MPSKSLQRYSDNDSFEKFQELRNRTVRVERRRSIRENSPFPNDSRGRTPYSEGEETAEEIELCDDENATTPRRKNIYTQLPPAHKSEQNKSPGKTTPRLECNIPPKRVNSSSQPNIVFFGAILAILLVMIVMKFPPSNDSVDVIDCSQFLELSDRFPGQDKRLFKSLKTGIESIYNKDKSRNSVITFFSTDQNLLDRFMIEIVQVAKNCIHQHESPLNLTHTDLNCDPFLEDHSLIIKSYKKELQKRSIMVVNNIEGVSSKVVPSFHAFADTINPLVAKSLIYISVRVPEEPRDNHANYFFQHLEQQWIDLLPNIRDPLITRLIDQAFFLHSS